MKKKLENVSWPTIIMLSILITFMNSGKALSEYDFTDDPDAIEKTANSVFMLRIYSADNEQIAIGSGFLAFDENILVTNYHVIEDAARIVAESDDHELFNVDAVCTSDIKLDIALIHLEKSAGLSPLLFDTDTILKRSMKVVAIGSPAGLMNTISIGNISGFYTTENKDWIQFTAPISSGSSGGPLLNKLGKVIGVTTATYASAQNVNMAVRATDVIKLYQRWNESTDSIPNPQNTLYSSAGITLADTTDDNYVYITSNGKKYHQNPNCSKMKHPIKIDLLDAIEKGYEPCGKCYR